MSRDWTPVEHYLSEQRHKEKHGDLFDFLENLKIVYDNGEEVILHPLEEMAIRRQFPTLGRLFLDGFMDLYERLINVKGGLDLLHKKDEELAEIIVSIESRSRDFDKETYLFKWFVGKLDEHFYYGERNDEMFIECMLNDAMALSRESFDRERFEAALQRHSLDVDIDNDRDFFETHANKLIYISENKKDLLDFDFWIRYELLLGEKITWDEYVAIDNKFDGDPHDVSFSNKRIINSFKASLKEFRESVKGKASLDEKIGAANVSEVAPAKDAPHRVREER